MFQVSEESQEKVAKEGIATSVKETVNVLKGEYFHLTQVTVQILTIHYCSVVCASLYFHFNSGTCCIVLMNT